MRATIAIMRQLFGMSAIVLLALAPCAQAAELDDYLWEKRVILIQQKAADDEALSALKRWREDISSRHIVWIAGTDTPTSNLGASLSPTDATTLLDEGFEDYQDANVLLIGKDGEVKATADILDLNTLFALIDTMPMRQAEMQR